MKFALIGYGAMGQLVATKARVAGNEIGVTFTSRDGSRGAAELSQDLRHHDVAVDFSVAGAVLKIC